MKAPAFKCFDVERASVRGKEPRVVLTRRSRGEKRLKRSMVRLPASLCDRLRVYAPDCPRTIAVVALAHEGMLNLIRTQQRLVSQWIPAAKGGRLHHRLIPQVRGTFRVEGGTLPRASTRDATIGIPEAMHDALRTEGHHVSVALVALVDWYLAQLIDGRERITVTPLKQPNSSLE